MISTGEPSSNTPPAPLNHNFALWFNPKGGRVEGRIRYQSLTFLTLNLIEYPECTPNRNLSSAGSLVHSQPKDFIMITKFGTASWQGTIKEGGGTVSTETAALKDHPYGFKARFDDGKGTNPEELVGAAHAACFAMALSLNLTENDFEAENIDAKSTVSLEKDTADGGFKVSKVHIEVTATVSGISGEKFMELAEATKEGCPISKLLNAEISMDAKLV